MAKCNYCRGSFYLSGAVKRGEYEPVEGPPPEVPTHWTQTSLLWFLYAALVGVVYVIIKAIMSLL